MVYVLFGVSAYIHAGETDGRFMFCYLLCVCQFVTLQYEALVKETFL